MQTAYLRRFSKDLDKLLQPGDKRAVAEVITLVKQAKTLDEVPGVQKLKGFKDAFRIRVGNYRIGVFVSGDIVQFARVAHRKDIYKIFP